ncbi:MAG: peptide chain release factor H [Hyphomicrobiaceae bacterium]|nr:MAG: peptide chain release factor H [Hyphomicrobiaceae bacterium]
MTVTRDRQWLLITSGRGPAECALAVAKLAHRMASAASLLGCRTEIIDAMQGPERGTFASLLIAVDGERAQAFAASWSGTHLWICQSPFRPHHKRKNWFVGVEHIAPAKDIDDVLRVSDVAFEAMRSSGPGGQHVNTTASAVRAKHKPTGLVAVAREERSQHMNKRLALARLAAALEAKTNAARSGVARERWAKHDALERGNAQRVFTGSEFAERT